MQTTIGRPAMSLSVVPYHQSLTIIFNPGPARGEGGEGVAILMPTSFRGLKSIHHFPRANQVILETRKNEKKSNKRGDKERMSLRVFRTFKGVASNSLD